MIQRGARIEVVEVSPRDGLQNEAQCFSVAQKVALIEHMIAAGSKRIEVASFVRADRVPQMADAEAVIAALDLPDDVVTIGLVMNERGVLRALGTDVREIGAVCVATDSFALRNQGQTSRQSLDIATDIVALAVREGRRAQITIGAAFGCPFEGEVDPDHVVEMARRIAGSGAREIGLADTIGVAVPGQVAALVTRIRAVVPDTPLRIHLHNTRGTAVANAWAAIEAGAVTLDASLGGIGGCPFAPAATGNVATEDLLYMLDRSGIDTGYDFDRTVQAGQWLAGEMGRVLPALAGRAGAFPRRDAPDPVS